MNQTEIRTSCGVVVLNHDTESAYASYSINDIPLGEVSIDYFEFAGMSKKEIKTWINETFYGH